MLEAIPSGHKRHRWHQKCRAGLKLDRGSSSRAFSSRPTSCMHVTPNQLSHSTLSSPARIRNFCFTPNCKPLGLEIHAFKRCHCAPALCYSKLGLRQEPNKCSKLITSLGFQTQFLYLPRSQNRQTTIVQKC